MNSNSHCFPQIEKKELPAPGSDKDAYQLFRPIYQPCSDRPATGAADNGDGGENGPEALKQIQKECFQNGYDAGCNTARQIARQELLPFLGEFREAFESYLSCYRNVIESFSDRIVALSLAIVGKIMNAEGDFKKERLGSLSKEFAVLLENEYRLAIQFNDEDLRSLSDILDGDHPGWTHAAEIKIRGEKKISKNQVHFSLPAQDTNALKADMLKRIEGTISNI